MGGDGTSTAADGNERAVPARFLVGGEPIKTLCRGRPPRFLPAIDVTGGEGCLARESRASVKRSFRADRVGVTPVDLARTHVNAINSGEPVLPRLVTEKRHRFVSE